MEDNVTFHVAKYIGKCKFVPRNVFTVVTNPNTSCEIIGEFDNYLQARQYANRLNTARFLQRQDEYTLESSLSNGEPLRPLKNDFMEISDVKN